VNRQPLTNIQALRACAALAVLCYHTFDKLQQMMPGSAGWLAFMQLVGPLGVDMFFVISGFLMVYTTWDAPATAAQARRFLLRRWIRVVPIYWLATSAMVLLLLLAPGAFRELQWQPLQILASYFFVPFRNAMGNTSPLVGVGWTLNFEMYFYLLFAVAMLFPRRIAMLNLALVSLVTLGAWLHPQHALLEMMTSPLLLEFSVGSLAAVLLIRFAESIPFFALFAGLLLLGYLQMDDAGSIGTALLKGVAMAAILLAVVAAEQRSQLRVPKAWQALGDSSYSLYLSHVFLLGALARVWLRLVGAQHATLFCLAIFALVPLIAHGIYRAVELPITRRLQRAFAKH